MESYKIKYLVKTKDKIAKVHKNIEDVDARVMNTKKFKKVIDKIVKMEEDVDIYSYCLKKSELNMLCMYIPSNVHKVDITNLIEIVRTRLDFKMAVLLYWNWQNNYQNKENIMIFESMIMNPLVLEQFKKHFKVNPIYIINWIKNGTVEINMSRFCAKGKDGTVEEYKNMMESTGLKKGTKLYEKCLELFYSVCQGDEYYRIGDEELVEKVKVMKPKLAKLLLLNMLERLSINDLKDYVLTAEFYSEVLGTYGESKYYEFFDRVDDKLEKKYHQWLNYIQLKQAFKDEKRIGFWSMYSEYGDMKYYKDRKFIIMRFHDFVVVEFCEKTQTYWYNNVYFDQAVKRLLFGNSTTEETIKWLNSKSNYLKKRENKGDWSIFEKMIMNNMLGIYFSKLNKKRRG